MYAEGMSADALPPEQPIRGQTVLLPTPPPGGFTARDLPRLIEAVDARFELLDGEVLMMAPATHWHHEVVDILKHALRRIAPQSVVIVAEMGVDLDHTVPEPGDQVFLAGGEPDDAMVVYTFELLPEGSYAPTGIFHSRVKLDRPFPIDIELPEVTW
jgi:hypothetical protein